MSSQFVDINSDGYKDILAGSFSGTPQIIMGGKDGYSEPEPVVDSDGKPVLISNFWNDDEDKWDETNRCDSTGHCTSAVAVDWDDDGDFDLLLGDYDGGKIFLRINDGSKSEPKFASTNVAVESDGKPIVVKPGLAAPAIVDWNQDGLFDIICGGSKGGVFLFQNMGESGSPEFAVAETLVDVADKNGSFIGIVAAQNGQPTQPGSSLHVEPFDYDGDGDLDLLIGGRSAWKKDNVEELTEAEQQRLQELSTEMREAMEKIREAVDDVDEEQRDKIAESDEYKELIANYGEISKERRELSKRADPTQSGDFVWLLRRK